MNKHRVKKMRHEYIEGKHSGLTPEDREWRIWFEMDKEDILYEELEGRMEQYRREKDTKEGVSG